jgi:hypothetical protein
VTSHVDADVLADYREGLLGERRSARIRSHLAGCEQCSSLNAGLAEVTALLAAAPTPPMPDHLVTRLENALAAETAARGESTPNGVAAAADAPDAPARAGVGANGHRPRIWRGQAGAGRGAWLGAAAAIAVVLVLGGLYGLTHHNGPSSTSAGSAGSGGTSNAPASRGRPESPASMSPFGLPAGSLHVTDSGTNYQPGTLASQVESLLARQKSTNARSSTGDATPTQASSAQLRSCVTLVTGGVPPSLVDLARYQGRPATVIVQAAAGRKPAQVWVVGPGCSASQRDLVTHTEVTGGA